MKKEWSPPELYDANGDLKKRWFVYYYENGKRKRVYGRINRITTKKGRLRVGQELTAIVPAILNLHFSNL